MTDAKMSLLITQTNYLSYMNKCNTNVIHDFHRVRVLIKKYLTEYYCLIIIIPNTSLF